MQHNLTVIYNKTGYKFVITIQNLINVICYYCKPKVPLNKGTFLSSYAILKVTIWIKDKNSEIYKILIK